MNKETKFKLKILNVLYKSVCILYVTCLITLIVWVVEFTNGK